MAGKSASAWVNSIRVRTEPDPLADDPVPAAPGPSHFTRPASARATDGQLDQLEELRSLVSTQVMAVGSRVSPRTTSALDSIVDSIANEPINIELFGPVMRALAQRSNLVEALANLGSFDELTYLVTLSKHRRALEQLTRAAADPTSTADTMMELISQEWWVFGGNLALMPSAWDIAELPPRCLPLVRFDGAVHLVLVESPHVDVVSTGANGGFAVDPAVYQAFDRARHLVGQLQDRREDIEQRLTFKASRASVSVVIGYPSSQGLSREVVREKIRELNTFTVGFTVVTYDELINIAEDMLPPQDQP